MQKSQEMMMEYWNVPFLIEIDQQKPGGYSDAGEEAILLEASVIGFMVLSVCVLVYVCVWEKKWFGKDGGCDLRGCVFRYVAYSCNPMHHLFHFAPSVRGWVKV